MFAMTGCGITEEKKKGEMTKPPVEELTEPLEGVESADSGQEDEENLYEVQFTGKDEVAEEKDGDFVYFKSEIHYPVFEGRNADNMNRFVTSVVEQFRENLPEAKENAKFDYEDSKANDFSTLFFPETEELIVSCVGGKDRYQSVFVRWLSDSGGAHPNIYCKAYVVDVSDGYKETFESMMQPYGLTTEEIVVYATAKIKEEHGEELFPFDDDDFLENWVYMFTQDNQWYFNDRGLVLFANPYDIAAYAYGMIECEIPYEVLEEGLKK